MENYKAASSTTGKMLDIFTKCCVNLQRENSELHKKWNDEEAVHSSHPAGTQCDDDLILPRVDPQWERMVSDLDQLLDVPCITYFKLSQNEGQFSSKASDIQGQIYY